MAAQPTVHLQLPAISATCPLSGEQWRHLVSLLSASQIQCGQSAGQFKQTTWLVSVPLTFTVLVKEYFPIGHPSLLTSSAGAAQVLAEFGDVLKSIPLAMQASQFGVPLLLQRAHPVMASQDVHLSVKLPV